MLACEHFSWSLQSLVRLTAAVRLTSTATLSACKVIIALRMINISLFSGGGGSVDKVVKDCKSKSLQFLKR